MISGLMMFAFLANPTWFAPDAASRQSVEKALAAARAANRRVMVVYEGSWCSLCPQVRPRLMELARPGYEVVRIRAEADSGLGRYASEVLKTPLDKLNGLLVLVLEKDGAWRAEWDGRRVLDKGNLSEENLKAVVTQYVLGPPAAELVRSGLASLEDGKAAWVEFGAVWCGWCRKMDKLFKESSAAPVLARYYQVISVDSDKNEGADPLSKRLGARDGVQGIPWFAVLDGKGNVLANSEGPKGNIGYPGNEKELAHFLTVLKRTARGISAEEVETVRAAIGVEPK